MSQVNRNINIFYYSRVSKLCIDMIKMMDNYGIINRFMLKCIDDMNPAQIPNGLDRVPTLIVAGIDKPLVANEAVKWFNDNRPYLIQQTSEMTNKKIIYNLTKNSNNMSGPKGFSDEHCGISDNFAYMETDEAQPKEFCRYGSDDDEIYTPPKDGKINTVQQKKLIADVDADRKQHEKEYAVAMKQEQVDKLILKEREQLVRNRHGI